MIKENIEHLLLKWIENFVEVANPALENFSPCPYAKKARLQNQIKIIISESNDIEETVSNHSQYLNNGYDVVIYCFDKSIDSQYLVNATKSLNNHRFETGFVFLEDHPDVEEYINGVKMNFGECALLLVQRLDKLNEASLKLKEKGYYNSWSTENLEDVVNWRNNEVL
jgi:hypothetical protein